MTNSTIPTHLADVTYYSNYYDYDYSNEIVLEEKLHIISMVIYSLAFVLGVTGNGLVIFITCFRMKKTVNTVWFLNLAIADFIFTFFLPLSIAYLALGTHWPFGLPMCKLNSSVTFLNMYASVYLLMVISIDRCIAVWCPVWAQNHRTPRLASFVVLGVWILSLVFSSPKLYFRQTQETNTSEPVTFCYDNYSSTQEQAQIIHQGMINFQFTFAFVIPFSVIICSNGAVLLRLRRSRLSRSNKPFKVITAVIVAFFVCWIPFHIFSFLDTKAFAQIALRWVVHAGAPLTFSLACLNSCLNPILYVFMGHDFKEQLRRSLFSAFENAFTEHSNVNTTDTKSSLTHELDSQKL
ncbi:chemerin-like receptor 1 [Tiliqua scincoides]|uniref:chemerin-like receptor 1 n=1 Tax=Tiliqua scincoides TaxID=71010 RepID=UPI0034620183